jgi:hypothetical protein
MPPVEGRWEEWQLRWSTTPPVDDARDEHIGGDEEEHQVRHSEADPTFDKILCPDDLSGHAGDGPATLGQMYDHQTDKDDPGHDVIGLSHVQELQGAQCRSS